MAASLLTKSTTKLGDETFVIDVESIKQHMKLKSSPLWRKIIIFVLGTPIMILYTILVCIIGKPLSSRVMSIILPIMLHQLNAMMRPIRKELLKNIHGDVLDLGAGSGLYIEYIVDKSVVNYVALEPNLHLHSKIEKNWAQNFPCQNSNYNGNQSSKSSMLPQLQICSDFLRNHIQNQQGNTPMYDYIILGNVMCEINDPEESLKLIGQCLKPGGYVYFCEHTLADYHLAPFTHMIQNWINPWWVRVSDGCNCNRDTINLMKRIWSDWDIVTWDLDMNGIMPMYIGMATNRKKEKSN